MRSSLAFVVCLSIFGCVAGETAQRLEGDWTVVGHEAPGVAAMDDRAAQAWVGRAAHFGPGGARFGEHTCEAPQYRTRTVPADSLLGIGFRVSPQALGFSAGSDVHVSEVRCEGDAWTAPGRLFIWIGPNRAYVPWDGVFFVVERQR